MGLPFARAIARRDGEKIFDILQGFVKSQVLLALVELQVLRKLLERPATAEQLSLACQVPPDRMARLLNAGVAMGLLKRGRNEDYALARRGAAILGVPGLCEMISHNRELYADLADPVVLLRSKGGGKLARFWPYVLGGKDVSGRERAEIYSELMSQTQALVAQDTLRSVSLRGVGTLMDVGGGAGAFLSAALDRYPRLNGVLFDLPDVVPAARRRLSGAEAEGRCRLVPGSFREGALPGNADAISLIRVLYDHGDQVVTDLLSKVFDALPAGGRLIISEPMSGGVRPDPAGDVYFSFYTMAMGTGQVRTGKRIAEMCEAAGFAKMSTPTGLRTYVTSTLVGVKP